MKKGVSKVSFVFLGLILMISLFSVMVVAEDDNVAQDEFNNCDDYCNDFWMSAMPECPGEEATSGTYPDCECGWECDEEESEDFDENNINDEEMNDADSEKNNEVWEEIGEEYQDEKEISSSIPVFEFILQNFRGELENRERRVGDIRKHIKNGDFEKARKSLKEYWKYVEGLEEEIDPEKRDEARMSAARIRKALKEIESEIPEGDREEFIDDIINNEEGIITAVEISSKIKELCSQLAELDPSEFERVCNIDDNAPKWKKKKYKEWTEEQRKEAEAFGSIMKECFRTSGRECGCEKITFYDFSVACEKASSFAVECDEGNEDSCLALDELEMPELPEHLQEVFDEVEAKEAQYEMHMPYECVEAGATTPKECSKIMIEKGAPEECKQALLDSGCEEERECRKICDKIMFDLHTPRECIDKEINNPDECARYMDSFKGDMGPRGPGFGPDCMSIKEPMERLKCFEGKLTESGNYYGPGDKGPEGGEITWQCKEHRIHWPPDCDKFMREELPKLQMKDGERRSEEIMKRERECADKCERENAAWDFTGGYCKCSNYQEGGENFERREGDQMGPLCDDCASKCPSKSGQRLRGTGCGPNGCECYYESDEPQYSPEYNEPEYSEPESSPEPAPEPSPITGEVVWGNEFLDYYYR